jgi:hypothetical protein
VGDENMDVDVPGPNANLPTEPVLRRTTRIVKPVDHGLDMQQVVPAPPSRKSKGKQKKKTPATVTSATPLPRPLVIGSKYMQFSVIDLTQVKVGTISL